ncbi:MAG: RNA polymerase sigma factor [Phycisphaerales bacterium]|nr:RNA polymerase sigma factor [Phycisphaerales bacterium]
MAERRALHTYALALLGNAADAEDLLQDVLLRIVADNRKTENARAFVMRCLRNAAIDRKRRAGCRPTASPLTDGGLAFVAKGADDCDPATRESHAATRDAIAGLPDAQREVVILKLYADLTFREISEVLNQPLGTITSRYARALEELRRLLITEVERV